MLNEREKKFITYWEKYGEKEGTLKHQLITGLPMAMIFGLAIPLLVVSGVFKLPKAKAGFFITMMIAVFIIIIFIAIFNKRFRWERNNDAYKELKAQLDKENTPS
jgi:prepilin signal peptidase PulO-like enzyme (type II secretory pathway)